MDDVASTASITAAITILALAGIYFILTRYGEFCFMEMINVRFSYEGFEMAIEWPCWHK